MKELDRMERWALQARMQMEELAEGLRQEIMLQGKGNRERDMLWGKDCSSR